MRFMQNRPFAANKAVSTALTLGLIVGVNACLSPLAVLARTSDLSALNGPAVFASEAAVGKEALHFGEGFKQMTPDQSKQAEALIKELDTINQNQRTNQSIDQVRRLGQEASKLYNAGQREPALSKWQEMYGLAQDIKYSEGEGEALSNMARFYVDAKQYVKAKYLGENAIELLANSSEQQTLAKARIALAQAYFGLDNPVWAIQQLDAALKILNLSQSKDPAEAASVMYLCASLCVQFNKPKDAIRFYQEAATYQTQANNYGEAVRIRATLVGLLIEMGWFTAALEEAEKVMSIAKTAPTDSNALQIPALQATANAQYALNDYAEARRTYDKLFALLPQIDQKMISEQVKANLNNGFGFVLAAIGDYDQAKQHLTAAFNYFKTVRDNFNAAQTANAIGVLEANEGNYGKSISMFHQAIDIHAVISPRAVKLNADTLLNMAAVEYRSGSFREAKLHLESAVAITAKLKNSSMRARLYQALAEILYKSSDITNAEANINKAIAEADKVKDDSILWRAYVMKSRIQKGRQEVELAKESITSALSYFRSPQSGDFPTVDTLGFPVSREDMAYHLAEGLASNGMTEQALLAAQQLKEENFVMEWMRQGGQVKPEDKDVFLEMSSMRARLHSAEAASTPDQLTKEWQSWLERFRALSASNKSLARLISPMPVSIQEVLSTIQKNNAVAVEYLCGSEATLAFTIDSQGRISSTRIAFGRDRFKSQVRTLLASVNKTAGDTAPGDNIRTVLASLYSELFPAGVRQFLPKTPDQMIVIIPDGPLFNLPFAALVDEKGQFLVQNHLLTMASSLTVLLDSTPAHNDDFSIVMASNQAKAELDQISNAVGPERVTVLQGKQIGLSNLEEQARGKSALHIPAKVAFPENNSLRSMLPFTIEVDGGARAISADRLFGSKMGNDLIVWSASSVNSKDGKGNALKIMSRGLGYAGARNVLMSLWSQPDAQRIDELVNFYKNKQAGMNPAQSLRKAQLAAISKDPDVKNWAGFQLLGPGY